MAIGWLVDAIAFKQEAIELGKRSDVRDVDALIDKAAAAGLTEAELLEAGREAAGRKKG